MCHCEERCDVVISNISALWVEIAALRWLRQ